MGLAKRAGLSASFLIALVICLAISMARPSQAALVVDLQNGAYVIADNGAFDSDPAIGSIINSTVVAGFGVSITVATSNSPGNPSAGILQVTSLNVQNLNANASTLMVRVSDTNFVLPGVPFGPMDLQSSVGGTFTLAPVGDMVSFQSFADPANLQPATTVLTPAQLFIKSNPGLTSESFNNTNNTAWSRGAGAYSLTNITTVVLSPNAQMNVAGTTLATAVPEPGTIAILGLAMPLLLFRRR